MASRSPSPTTRAPVAFVDWRTSANNDFLAVSQLWVVGPLHTRRTDIVCFVNGIPFVLLELKASHRSIEHPAVTRTRMRIDQIDTVEICRVDVARSSVPVRARMSAQDAVLWVRMNNSTRSLPEAEAEEYIRDHWG